VASDLCECCPGCGYHGLDKPCPYPALLKAAEAVTLGAADGGAGSGRAWVNLDAFHALCREVERAKEAFFRTLAGEGGDVKDAKA
jgi:hypothetical protein